MAIAGKKKATGLGTSAFVHFEQKKGGGACNVQETEPGL
jgi:hypothetical protein